jgi:hypothetical protein
MADRQDIAVPRDNPERLERISLHTRNRLIATQVAEGGMQLPRARIGLRRDDQIAEAIRHTS